MPPENNKFADGDKLLKCMQKRIFLPPLDQGIDCKEYLEKYIKREFPNNSVEGCVSSFPFVYCVPSSFQAKGERQACLAEETVFKRLQGLISYKLPGLWVLFFHSACYAGHSYRNHRIGKLMIREHDFVVFVKHEGKFYSVIIEVKSTNDLNTNIYNLEKTSDAKVIKNNKRSAQHQLRDHLEILTAQLGISQEENKIQSYIMWPFLGAYTRAPKQEVIKRWKEDSNLHVFEDVMSSQAKFNEWFAVNVIGGKNIDEGHFTDLLNKYLILSCGIFVDEIHQDMLALLTQEQLTLLNSDVCQQPRKGPLVVHGAAGTGKTLLVLKKLQQLFQIGQLNENNRALYICYWPGIRCDIDLKLEQMGLSDYVDTTRFYISLNEFFKEKNRSYKHIFMDEAEALCLALQPHIIHSTFKSLYERYHKGNCNDRLCPFSTLEENEDISEKIQMHQRKEAWGELWFTVDINQASMFLPKHSPKMLKSPTVVLNKVMRSTGNIFHVFKQFYTNPYPELNQILQAKIRTTNICLGHHIQGPNIFWANIETTVDETVANIVIDLCSTKGFKAREMCVLPFLVNERLTPESINRVIDFRFVENGYRPRAVRDVEDYLRRKESSDFLITWALRLKGLEFKVVIIAVDGDDFDACDPEDRKKIYIIASRCTCLLILVSKEYIKNCIDSSKVMLKYPYGLKFSPVNFAEQKL